MNKKHIGSVWILGELIRKLDLLVVPTREYYENQLMPMNKGKITILRSNMSNGQAVILGAVSLVNDMNQNQN